MLVDVDDVYIMRGKLGFVCSDMQQFTKGIAGATLFTKRQAEKYYEYLSTKYDIEIVRVTKMEIEQ